MGVRQQSDTPLPTLEPWALTVGRQPVRLGDRGACWALGSGKGVLEPRREAGAGDGERRGRAGAWQTEPAEGACLGTLGGGARRGCWRARRTCRPCAVGLLRACGPSPWSLLASPSPSLHPGPASGTLCPSSGGLCTHLRGQAGQDRKGQEGEYWGLSVMGAAIGTLSWLSLSPVRRLGPGQRVVLGTEGSEGQSPGGTRTSCSGPS